ncbi:MAG: hypothetical protein FWD76_03785 [Firmicutes bacterium]|nr:hypothetical protein [Bacillota bacterium]
MCHNNLVERIYSLIKESLKVDAEQQERQRLKADWENASCSAIKKRTANILATWDANYNKRDIEYRQIAEYLATKGYFADSCVEEYDVKQRTDTKKDAIRD